MSDNAKEKIKFIAVDTMNRVLEEKNISLPKEKELRCDVEVPKNPKHGDFAINIALTTSAATGQNAIFLAKEFKQAIDSKKEPSIKMVKVAGPGFINIFLTEESRSDILLTIQKENDSFGRSSYGQGKKINIEFVSANPTGPLTIAHARQAVVGDTIARILKATGFEVHKEFYLNDAGKQVNLLGESVMTRLQELGGRSVQIPEEGYHGLYIVDLAKELQKMSSEATVEAAAEFASKKMLALIKHDLEAVDVIFDEYYSEKSLYKNNAVEKALKKLKDKGHLYDAEGALWFRSTDFKDDKDRVLKKQTGEYTYFAPDIAYHEEKFKRGFDQLINLWGPDHHGYIPRVKAAIQALGYAPERLRILIVQLVTLYRGGEQVRMSKRAGEYVTLRDLVDEVGADATRFFFLMRRVESLLDFDLELAKQKSQDNPVYYLQYAHARISSLISSSPNKVVNPNHALLVAAEEIDLLKKMGEYPEVLKQAADSLEPYRLVDYLRELATLFHKFYASHKIINSDNMELTATRLQLSHCVGIILRNGLELLGVSHPETM